VVDGQKAMRSLIAWVGTLLALGASLGGASETSAAPWKQGDLADKSTHHQITLAMGAVKDWWGEHKNGFEDCPMLMPRDEWRKLDSSQFFGDPKSKSVAYSAWNSDGTDYWWATRDEKDHGPWKISAPQQGGFTFEWTIGVGEDPSHTQIVQVRMIYPIDMGM